jgi:hypothetical protein
MTELTKTHKIVNFRFIFNIVVISNLRMTTEFPVFWYVMLSILVDICQLLEEPAASFFRAEK